MAEYVPYEQYRNYKPKERIKVPEEWLTDEALKARAGVYEIKETTAIAVPTHFRMFDRTHDTVSLKWNTGFLSNHSIFQVIVISLA